MYDRQKAVDYALYWWNKRNPKFYNFELIGGDCTNFISQCIFAGGVPMDFSSKFGWYYRNLLDRSYSWTGVNEFFEYATNNISNSGIKLKEVDISSVEIGDIVQLRQNDYSFNHAVLITKIEEKSPDGIFVSCHSFDALNKRLSLYFYKELRFLKVIN